MFKFKTGDKVKIKEATEERFIEDVKNDTIFKIEYEYNNKYLIYSLDHSYGWVKGENLILVEKENNMEFTKSDLKNGMVVESRNGWKFLYMSEQLIGKDIYDNINLHYNDNLSHSSKSKLDIVKVYNVNWENVHFLEDIFNNLTTIWECAKKEYPILTKYQYELLKKLNGDFNWVARSEIGELHLYSGNIMPYRRRGWGFWEHEDGAKFFLFDCLDDFDFVKWEDEEPWNIKELIENCEVE